MKPPKPKKKSKDVLDKIEDFIESRIEDRLKKGFDDIERFLKKEIRDFKEKHLELEDSENNPFSYFEAFLKDRKVASVAPSTKFLVGKVMKRMEMKPLRVVVEYGPAAGVMTRQILSRLPTDGILAAVELYPEFMPELKKLNDPRLKAYQGSVMDIDKLVAPLNLPLADVVVSGIPFSFLKPVERHALLHKTVDLLRPGGRFIAYQVTTHLVPLMKYHFEDVDIDFEVRNLPPHFVFTGYK